MKRIKVTQIKSGIDRNETAKRTLVALGLRKLNASVEVTATPQILGMVKRVGHLIKVEEIQANDVQSNQLQASEVNSKDHVPQAILLDEAVPEEQIA